MVEGQPFKNARPSFYLFAPNIRGPLARWLAQPAQNHTRQLLKTFLQDIHEFASIQAAEISPTMALKKSLVATSGDSANLVKAEVKKADKNKVTTQQNGKEQDLAVKGKTLVDGYVTSIVGTALELK
eukprot:7380478-Prymnesium_polylepis.1